MPGLDQLGATTLQVLCRLKRKPHFQLKLLAFAFPPTPHGETPASKGPGNGPLKWPCFQRHFQGPVQDKDPPRKTTQNKQQKDIQPATPTQKPNNKQTNKNTKEHYHQPRIT